MPARKSSRSGSRATGKVSTFADAAAPRERSRVRRVLVVADHQKEGVLHFERVFVPWLEARVERVDVEGDARELVRARHAMSPSEAARDLPDLLVVLGGDGAILGAVRAFADHPVPTVGINFGRVGFLASVPSGHWEEALEAALEGEAPIEERMRLELRLEARAGEVRSVALNDVVFERGATQGMLVLRLFVDGTWVTDYRADGLILATPSGSTAHSLSAGGPILYPAMSAILVTPLCPQGLAHRPLILHASSALEVAVVHSSGMATIAVDGQGFFPVQQGERARIARTREPYPLLTWSGLDPYRRLRERLGWSGLLAPEPASPEDAVDGRPPRRRHTDAGHGGVL